MPELDVAVEPWLALLLELLVLLCAPAMAAKHARAPATARYVSFCFIAFLSAERGIASPPRPVFDAVEDLRGATTMLLWNFDPSQGLSNAALATLVPLDLQGENNEIRASEKYLLATRRKTCRRASECETDWATTWVDRTQTAGHLPSGTLLPPWHGLCCRCDHSERCGYAVAHGDPMHRHFIPLVLALVALALAGCSTISGFGKDVEAIGGGVSADSGKKK